MNKFTVNEFRHAVSCSVQDVTANTLAKELKDEELLNSDFRQDLHMCPNHLVNVVEEFQKSCRVQIPKEIVRVLPNNTIRSFLDTVNMYVREASVLK